MLCASRVLQRNVSLESVQFNNRLHFNETTDSARLTALTQSSVRTQYLGYYCSSHLPGFVILTAAGMRARLACSKLATTRALIECLGCSALLSPAPSPCSVSIATSSSCTFVHVQDHRCNGLSCTPCKCTRCKRLSSCYLIFHC